MQLGGFSLPSRDGRSGHHHVRPNRNRHPDESRPVHALRGDSSSVPTPVPGGVELLFRTRGQGRGGPRARLLVVGHLEAGGRNSSEVKRNGSTYQGQQKKIWTVVPSTTPKKKNANL